MAESKLRLLAEGRGRHDAVSPVRSWCQLGAQPHRKLTVGRGDRTANPCHEVLSYVSDVTSPAGVTLYFQPQMPLGAFRPDGRMRAAPRRACGSASRWRFFGKPQCSAPQGRRQSQEEGWCADVPGWSHLERKALRCPGAWLGQVTVCEKILPPGKARRRSAAGDSLKVRWAGPRWLDWPVQPVPGLSNQAINGSPDKSSGAQSCQDPDHTL